MLQDGIWTQCPQIWWPINPGCQEVSNLEGAQISDPGCRCCQHWVLRSQAQAVGKTDIVHGPASTMEHHAPTQLDVEEMLAEFPTKVTLPDLNWLVKEIQEVQAVE